MPANRKLVEKLQSVLKGYYLATPVFLLIDLALGWSLRLTIPWETSAAWYGYYLLCFFIGYLLWGGSLLGYLLAIIESAVNITLLLMTVMVPLVHFDPATTQPETLGLSTTGQLVHFLLVGSVFLIAFYTNPLISRKNL